MPEIIKYLPKWAVCITLMFENIFQTGCMVKLNPVAHGATLADFCAAEGMNPLTQSTWIPDTPKKGLVHLTEVCLL